MGYAIFVLAALVLLAGFLLLTVYEERRGARVFSKSRAVLDAQVTRMQYILEHVDLWTFAKDEIVRSGHRLGHDIARLSLDLVRAVERLLTRLVRRMRPPRPVDESTREARPFVKTLSDFKERLKKAAEDGTENGSEGSTESRE